jgi:UDP-GlcNAc:undecaprenyl-phosphate GlcNAc-1-phosphate transferase
MVLGSIAGLVSMAVTPLIIRLAHHFDVLDKPGTRKIHLRIVPRMGGLAVFTGMLVSLFLYCFFYPDLFKNIFFERKYLHIITGALVMMVLGIVDDKYGLNAKVKFTVQIVVAAFVIYNGLKIERITNPFGSALELGYFAYPVTLLWIVGVTNAINLSDGLDGLATGIALIVSITMFAVSFTLGNKPGMLIMSAVLTGSLVGFLKYNFNPARIFMGDTGSLFIGFLLATLSIKGTLVSSTTVSMLTPLIALGVPIIDTLFAMVRRMVGGRNPFAADKQHFHHRLLSSGLTQKQAVVVIYSVCVIFGVIAFVMTAAQSELAAGLLLIFGIMIFTGIRKLGYVEGFLVKLKQERYRQKRKLYKSLYLEPDAQPPVWFRIISKKGFFELAVDSVIIFGALYVTRYVFDEGVMGDKTFISQLAVVAVCSYGSFALFGYYREMWRYISLDSIGKYVKGVTAATLASYFALAFGSPFLWIPAKHIIVFWLVMMFLVSATRLIYNFYSTYQKRELTRVGGGERLLIYGAGDRGEVLLSAIIKEDLLNYRPIGFIDDNPAKQNREILGCKILGDINSLDQIVDTYSVQRIVISSPYINGHREGTLKDICRKHGIKLCHFKIQLDPVKIDD